MHEAAETRSYAAALAVLVVAEWLYLDWASRAPKPLPDNFVHAEWITLHERISHSNPDVIDPLDCDVLGHRDLRASVVGWAWCSSRHDTIAERERHESNSSSIDQHVALRAPNMPMHQVVV
jgi:hypothetical protein